MEELPLILRVKERREGSIPKGQWPSVVVFEVETARGKATLLLTPPAAHQMAELLKELTPWIAPAE